MLFALPVLDGAAPVRPISYYVRVDYRTLKRRAAQLDRYRGDWQWEFLAATVGRESGFSYRAVNESTGAAGLFQVKRATAQMLGVDYETMRESAELQLRAGKLYLHRYVRQQIVDFGPELLKGPEFDLWSAGYYGHNQGHGALRAALKKVRAAGLPMTWASVRRFSGGQAADVAEEVAELASRFRERHAELVKGQKSEVAATAMLPQEDELEGSLRDRPAEDDGTAEPIPPALQDPAAAPSARISTAGKVAIAVGVTVFVGAATWFVAREYRHRPPFIYPRRA